MAIGQGINKTTAFKIQTGLGVPASGSGSQIMRRETSNFMLAKDTYENNEIASHQQGTGVTHGLRKPTGKLTGVLSPNTYSTLFASLLRAAFAAVTPATAVSVTIAGSTGAFTITRAAGDYLADGFKIGQVIRLTVGGLDAANINKNLLITGLTATVATVTVLNGVDMVTEGPIAGCTVTVQGKTCVAPLTGHTSDYWTVEDFYSDITQSEVFTDVQAAKADIGLPSTGNSTFSMDFIALDRSISGAQVLTTPTAETTTPVLTAVNGVMLVNGTAVANITGATINIDGTVDTVGAVVGSNVAPDVQRGRIKVSGQLTAFYQDGVIPALFDDATLTSAVIVMADDATATAKFISFNMSAIKLTGDTPDDGEKAIVRTYPFVAELNSAGGAALANDQTILTIQDSDAA